MSSGGGGGQSAPTTTTVNQSSLPAYAQPYFEQMMGQASAAEQLPYQQYGGDLVAGMNANQQNALAGYYGQGNSTGTNYMAQAGNIANNAASTAYNPAQVNAGQTNTGTFDTGAANAYMNPYVQSALDVQKNQAIRDYGNQQVISNNDMASRGAFGGTRQAILNAEGQRNLGTNLSNIEATGMNTAYNNAQQQFNADQARSLQSQQGNVQQNLAAQQANQQAGQNAAQLNANTALQGATTLGNIGSTMNTQAQAALGGISGLGSQQQQIEQNQMNAAYNNFQNQVNWPQNQIAWYGNVLHGTPVAANSTSTSLAPTGSLAGQLSGIGALGLGAAATKSA